MARASLAALAVVVALGCGQVSNDPNGLNGQSGSANAGAAGSAGAGGRGGSTAQGGSGGSALADAGDEGGASGAAGAAMGGEGGSGGWQLPPGCPEINPIPAPGQEIVIQSLNFNTGEVVLKNVSDTTVTILGGRQGWQWCNFPAYWTIYEAADVELSPGETFAFVSIYRGIVRTLDPEGGEMGIYTTTGSFTTVDYMRAFVSWGEVVSQREPTAVMGGYWIFNERIEVGPGDDGFVIVGEADRASGYQAVDEECLVAPPNEPLEGEALAE